MAKVVTARAAAELIEDGDVVASSCFGLAGWPEEVACAVRDRYLEVKHPRGITFMHAGGAGDFRSRGAGIWAEDGAEGLVKRVVTGHMGAAAADGQGYTGEKDRVLFLAFGQYDPMVHGSRQKIARPFYEDRAGHLPRPPRGRQWEQWLGRERLRKSAGNRGGRMDVLQGLPRQCRVDQGNHSRRKGQYHLREGGGRTGGPACGAGSQGLGRCRHSAGRGPCQGRHAPSATRARAGPPFATSHPAPYAPATSQTAWEARW